MKCKHAAQLHAHTEHFILLFQQLPHFRLNILTNLITYLAHKRAKDTVRTWFYSLDQES